MEDLEIWKIVDLDFLSTGLLISSHGNGLNKGRAEHGTTVTLPDEVVAKAYYCVKVGSHGVREAADQFGMPRTTLSSIVNKRSRNSVTDEVDKLLEVSLLANTVRNHS